MDSAYDISSLNTASNIVSSASVVGVDSGSSVGGTSMASRLAQRLYNLVWIEEISVMGDVHVRTLNSNSSTNL